MLIVFIILMVIYAVIPGFYTYLVLTIPASKWRIEDKKDCYRTDVFSFYGGWHRWRFTFDKAGYFDERPMINASFGLGQIYWHLPFKTGIDECEPDSYGFYFYGESPVFTSFWWCWGQKRYCFYMPWDYDWVRTSALKKDGTWEHEYKGDRKEFYNDKWKEIIKYETYPYKYMLRGGGEQNVNATIKTSEMEWRWRWFTWLPINRKISRAIDINFDGEVGSEAGSWKGGVTGCSYSILPNETPLQCLRRMERDRRFDR